MPSLTERLMKHANPILTVAGALLAVFLVYMILQDVFDPVSEKFRAIRKERDPVERLAMLRERYRPEDLPKIGLPLAQILRNDPDARVRQTAASELQKVPPSDPSALRVCEALVAALDDADQGVRAEAASTLGHLQPPTSLALPHLIKIVEARLQGPSESETTSKAKGIFQPWGKPWYNALNAIAAIAIDDPEGISALMRFAKCSDPEVRRTVAGAVLIYGKGREREWDLLRSLRDDEDETVRAKAYEAVAQMGSPTPILRGTIVSHRATSLALSWLVEGLGDSSPNVIGLVASRIQGFRPDPQSVQSSLASALQRVYRLSTPVSDETNPFRYRGLEVVIDQSSREPRINLMRTIGLIGGEHTASRRALLEQVEDPSESIREAAAEALGPHLGHDEKALAALLKLASDSQNRVSFAAIRSIAQSKNFQAEALAPIREYVDKWSDPSSFRQILPLFKQAITPGKLLELASSVEELRKGNLADRLLVVFASDPNTKAGLRELEFAIKNDNDRRVRGEAIIVLEGCNLDHRDQALGVLDEVCKNDPSFDLRHWGKIVADRLKAKGPTPDSKIARSIP
ncbi:HEAT repeat domain-containing protein [Singulisphaera sp. PoT]|uniref:HEAT repeat domain-containing protein n=1 Tax=Singulisphaera sp. PoT TaxID=3411797 RepID=UPI003BF57D9B